MILTMIIAIAVAVLLAVFIGKNLAYSTSLWLFKDFGETNVAVIVLIAFAAGIVFALLCILLGKIAKETRDAEKAKAVKESKEEKDSKPAKEPISFGQVCIPSRSCVLSDGRLRQCSEHLRAGIQPEQEHLPCI